MRLLILDFFRRYKWLYGFVGLCFAAPPTYGIGIGFGIGIAFAPIFNSREILSLPVSRKELWRAQWIIAFVPVILSTLVRLLVAGSSLAISSKAIVSPSGILLLASFQWVCLGTLLAVYIPVSYCLQAFASVAKRLLVYGALAGAAIVLAVILESHLPTQWHELTGGTVLLMAMGLYFTAIGFFHSPKVAARTITPMANFSEPSGQSSRTGNVDSKMQMGAGLSGLKLLVGKQILLFLGVGITSGITSQLPIVMGELLAPDRAIERGMVLFAPNTKPATALFFVFPVLYFAACILLMPEFLGVRHLRALPLTTRTLTAMFTLTPILFWLTLWVFPLAAYWILSGHLPSTLRLDLLAGLLGLMCLVGSSAMQTLVKTAAQFAMLFVLPCAGIALYLYVQPLSTTVTSLIGVSGLIGVAVSFLLNYRAFQRNSSLYISKLRFLGLARPRWISQ